MFGVRQAIPTHSAFHCFIEFMVTEILSDEINRVQLDIRQDTLDRFTNLPAALDDLQLKKRRTRGHNFGCL